MWTWLDSPQRRKTDNMSKLQIPLLGYTAEKGERKMKKEEFIRRRGEAAYEKKLQQMREWNETHPEEAKAHHQEASRKGGRRYEKH